MYIPLNIFKLKSNSFWVKIVKLRGIIQKTGVSIYFSVVSERKCEFYFTFIYILILRRDLILIKILNVFLRLIICFKSMHSRYVKVYFTSLCKLRIQYVCAIRNTKNTYNEREKIIKWKNTYFIKHIKYIKWDWYLWNDPCYKHQEKLLLNKKEKTSSNTSNQKKWI